MNYKSNPILTEIYVTERNNKFYVNYKVRNKLTSKKISFQQYNEMLEAIEININH
jgi:anaerobic ribonucleoside-triphosphate reductase